MTEIVAPERWIKCVGKKGTIVFMDGRGFHKGGDARQCDRTVFVSMFTSRPAWIINSFDRPAKIQASEDRARALALSAK
jgi:hypothetical protein